MQLRLRTKLTLVMTSLVLLVAAVLSGVFAAQLLDQLLQATNTRADDLEKQVFLQAKHALVEAGQQGLRPASDAPEEIHDFVRHAFEVNEGLRTQLKAAKENPLIYEVSITDLNGMVLVSTDESMPGSFLPRRTALSQLVQRNFLHQVKVLAGPSKVFELDYPFNNANQPFGEVRVALNVGLLLNEIAPSLRTSGTIALLAVVASTLLAAIVSRATLAPLQDIAAQLDRISAGQYDAPSPEVKSFGGSGDELGLVSRKITQVGQQLRGVHEIFSTMRENMNSVMAGLEDGLLLFTRDARAVMISPAAEKFLGEPAGHFLGRRVTEIFPPGHPLYGRNGAGDERRAEARERQRASHPRRWRTHGRARDATGPRLAGKHQYAASSERTADGARTHHRGRGARSEESAEFDAALAGKPEGIAAPRIRRCVAAGRTGAGQRNRPAGRGREALSRFHAADGYPPGTDSARGAFEGSTGVRATPA